MDDTPDLRHLLDAPAPPARPEDLHAIVKRAGRRGARLGAALGVVLLAAGGLGGYLLSNHSSSGRSVVATAGSPSVPGPGPSAAPGAARALAPSTGAPGGSASSGALFAGTGALTHVLTRDTSGGVTVRIFRPQTAASAVQFRLVEVSTSGMVGTLTSVQGSGATAQADTEVLGSAEGAPVVVVAAFTPATVTKVSWSGEGGGDTMAPSSDFVALAVEVTKAPVSGAAIGTLTFTDSAGHVVQTQHLTLNDGVVGCLQVTPATGTSGSTNVSVATGCGGGVNCASGSGVGRSGNSGSGSSGSGSSGSATGSSGSSNSGSTTGNSGFATTTPANAPTAVTAQTAVPLPCTAVPPVSEHCSVSGGGTVCSGSASGSVSGSGTASANSSSISVVPPVEVTPRSSSVAG